MLPQLLRSLLDRPFLGSYVENLRLDSSASLKEPDRQNLYVTCRRLFICLRLGDYRNGLTLREDKGSGARPRAHPVQTITYSPRDPYQCRVRVPGPNKGPGAPELHPNARDVLCSLQKLSTIVEFRIELKWNPRRWTLNADHLLDCPRRYAAAELRSPKSRRQLGSSGCVFRRAAPQAAVCA